MEILWRGPDTGQIDGVPGYKDQRRGSQQRRRCSWRTDLLADCSIRSLVPACVLFKPLWDGCCGLNCLTRDDLKVSGVTARLLRRIRNG